LLDLKGDIPVPGCLADGRVFNFPFNWLGLTELDPRQPVEGKIKNATVSQAAGHWYISFQVEQETLEPIHPSG
ncbi:hypothetical protein, partial [Aeromonas caviae]|uniref:hypothetical protein n=1 Tax=Aeromonas caviae TaxID=648 RepID=UPI001CC64AC1